MSLSFRILEIDRQAKEVTVLFNANNTGYTSNISGLNCDWDDEGSIITSLSSFAREHYGATEKPDYSTKRAQATKLPISLGKQHEVSI